MLRKMFLGLILALLSISMLTWTFAFSQVRLEPRILKVINAALDKDTVGLCSGTFGITESIPSIQKCEFVLGEVLLKFKSCVSMGSANGIAMTGIRSVDELNRLFGVTQMQKVVLNVYKLTLSKDVDVISVAREYEADSDVEFAEPNHKYHICVVPNDTNYTLQWAHQAIQSELAWDIETGDPNVIIAVVDTGVDWDHPDLAANIWKNTDEVIDGTDTDGNGYIDDVRGYDFVDTTEEVWSGEDGTIRDNDPMDFDGHGTHCAGIAAAVTNNDLGIAGVSWSCKIMPVRAGYKTRDGWGNFETDDAAAAIVYAVDNGASIISMSWGGDEESMLIRDAITYAYNHGAVLVAAAGNQATSDKHYPAAYSEVIAVTATDRFDNPALFTNFGDWVEIAAPGVDIYSTVWNDSYIYTNGTSMSTAQVAGLAALVLSHFPNVTSKWIRLWLQDTGDDLGASEFDEHYGYGRINARKAVEQVPPDHDLLILDLHIPSYLKPGTTRINTTVLNFGIKDETDVEVQLLLDGRVADSTFIDSIEGAAWVSISWDWILTEGTYNVTSYVVPVAGETIKKNNAVFDYIIVRGAKRLRVPEDYSTIQTAVNSALSGWGDVVQVASGIYNENVVVNKTLSIIGEGQNNTVIAGISAMSIVVDITANNVSISGFTIRNGTSGIEMESEGNSITGNTITSNGYGIFVSSHGSNFISNNSIISNEYDGIQVFNSSHNQIIGNIIEGNLNGIFVIGGCWAWYTKNNIVSNTVSSNRQGGIWLGLNTYGNTLRNNNLSDNGWNFGVEGGFLEDFIQDVDASNTVDGKPIYYWVNQRGRRVPVDAGYVAAINSTNITIKDLNLTENFQGVLFARTSNSIIENVTVSNNWYGIHLISDSQNNTICNNEVANNEWRGINILPGCSQNTVSGNKIMSTQPLHTSSIPQYTWFDGPKRAIGIYVAIGLGSCQVQHNKVAWNDIGVYIDTSCGHMIADNEISDNSVGIVLCGTERNKILRNIISENSVGINLEFGVSGNEIYHNNFIDNKKQVYIEEVEYSEYLINTWDAGHPSGGNYWSDYNGTDLNEDGIGDTPYLIVENNQDRYPLMNPYTPLLGDLDDDREVNIKDLAIWALAFGSYPGHTRWNSKADIDDNGTINMIDAARIAKNFGKSL